MGVKLKKFKLSDLSLEKGFRFDMKFLIANTKDNNYLSYYSFNTLFDVIEKEEIEELPDELYYSEIGNVNKNGDINPVFLKLNDIETDLVNAAYYKKIHKGDIIHPKHNSILLSSVRPNLKKFVFINEAKNNIFFTKAFIQITSKKIIPLVAYYAFRTVFYDNLISVARQGKGYPTLKSTDLKYMIFNKNIIDKLMKKQFDLQSLIIKIEKQISILKSKIVSENIIINDCISNELMLNNKILKKLKNEKINDLSLYNFTNNKDLRCSCKFHSKSARFAMKELTSITCKKIKNYLSEPIVLGESISPSDYDENGTYKYLSMASIKTWEFNEENAQSVSDLYFTNSIKKVQKDDIIIARSGEGTIGKVAIINNEVDAIFCDFTMRIRLKDYNPLFAYYYFRTDYFQELIYGYKKGLGNNTNIFPNQIQEFPIPDVSLEKQNEIVLKIKSEIDKQNEIENEIHNLRNTIHKIINESIM